MASLISPAGRGRGVFPARAFLACILLMALGRAAAGPVRGFPENSSDPRSVLVEEILPDLRVFIDLIPKDRPRNRSDGELPLQEVKDAVTLGIGNWASVIEGMRFRLVDTPDSANLVLRFREYGMHISGGATAEAFMPSQWRSARGRLPFDFSCGAKEFGKDAAGETCRENDNNIILFQAHWLAFRRIHFLTARMQGEYLAGMTDRAAPSKRFFRFLPDARFRIWPPDRSTCVAGKARAGMAPVWDPVCLSDSDWAALPFADRFGREVGAYDIAALVQHEVGHALLGAHTGEGGGCLPIRGGDFEDYSRDPVYRGNPRIRQAARPAAPARPAGSPDERGYSILFPGNGLDAAWNSRGMFPLDAARLAAGSADLECRDQGEWHGYAVSYPRARGWIVLSNPKGGTKYLDDWGYALRLMGWPVAGGEAGPVEWFQVGILPKP